jgi:uncharacterized protein YggE
MYAPIFEVVSADANVQSNLGVSPTRFYPFGEAPPNVDKPYAVWQLITGLPENYLNQVPDIDQFSIQVDVYATTADQARDVAQALRDAVEPHAHVIAWRGEERDLDTRNYRISFDLDWMVSRETVS